MSGRPGAGGPPRAVRSLLSRLLPREDREQVLDDLAELHARAARERGRRRADLWYLAQAARELAALASIAWRREGGMAGGRTFAARLATDARYAVRSLAGSPVFTLLSGLTLALGIAGVTTVFSVVDAVLLRPLPYPQGEDLVHVVEVRPDGTTGVGLQDLAISYPNLSDLRDQAGALEGLAAWQGWAFVDQTPDGVRVRRRGGRVSPDFFEVVGVRPALGRFFAADDPEGVVVVSHRYWTGRLGADPDVVGRPVPLDVGRSYTVVGVAPPGFVDPMAELVSRHFDLDPPEAWVLTRFADHAPLRANLDVWSLGRLAPGAGLERARREVAAVSARLEAAYPDVNEGRRFTLATVREARVDDVRATLVFLLGAVTLLLAIACANVANLFLSRATTREREMAVRTALGAPRRRLLGQLLTEAAVFALGAGAAGVALASLGVTAVRRLASAWLPPSAEPGLDLRVVAFAVVVSLATAALFGLAPALQATRGRLGAALRGGRDDSGRSGARLRAGFAAAQLALAVMLLSGMGLVLRSFLNLAGEDLGVDVTAVATVEVALDGSVYRTAAEQNAVVAALEDALRERPGVVSAGMVNALPMSGQIDATPIVREDDEASLAEGIDRLPRHPVRTATAGYFETAGIPLVRGRGFAPSDGADTRAVALVNEALAARLYPDEDPVGRRVIVRETPLEIVGVVGNVRHFGPSVPPEPALYTLYDQEKQEWMRRTVTLVLRTRPDARPGVAELREAVAAVGPALTVTRVRGLDELLANHLAGPRFRLLLAGLFGAVALVLATVGVGAVAAYAVARRSREYAVRKACGAGAGAIVGSVLRGTSRLVLLGLGAGFAGALAAGRLVRGLLHEVSPADPLVLAGVAAVLTLTAFAAALPPARRAVIVDPARILREE